MASLNAASPRARLWSIREDVSMLKRRQFIGDCVATAISACALSTAPARSFSLEDAVQSQIDSAFSEAVRQIASIRETNRSTGLDVTDQFDNLVAAYSLTDFRAYLAQHYRLTRAKTGAGNEEFAYLNDKTLKNFDKRFLTYDRLTVGFRYDADWKDITQFRATLGNLGGI
jgi:hypothetical protein